MKRKKLTQMDVLLCEKNSVTEILNNLMAVKDYGETYKTARAYRNAIAKEMLRLRASGEKE